MSVSDRKPATDEEWAIYSLNIHGTFFERWCANLIKSVDKFQVESTNYPVEFPFGKSGATKESALDVRASYLDQDRDLLTLLVECKKNNPDFVDWIFFPKIEKVKFPGISFPAVYAKKTSQNAIGVEVTTGYNQKYYENIPITDEARETKGKYQSSDDRNPKKDKDKTKTSNAAISDAAYQVALATQAIFTEERGNTVARYADRNNFNQKIRQQVFVPIILTTANLYTCEFDIGDIDGTTGEIPFEKVKLLPHQFMIYQYALPPHLQIPDTGDSLKTVKQMPILVIHSDYFEKFLKNITGDEGWRYFKSGI